MHYRRSGYVWILSALGLALYAVLGLVGVGVPGIEDLVTLLSQAQGWEFMAAAFTAIMIEGLYLVGNFFPGTSIVTLLAILSSVGNWWRFAATIFSIFIGWCVAGAINILIAQRALKNRMDSKHVFVVRDNFWYTWLPAFRANYEVSQIAAGGDLKQVLFSAVRVRFFASLIAAIACAIVSYTIDLKTIDNEEGFVSLFIFVVIMMYIGWLDLIKAKEYARSDRT